MEEIKPKKERKFLKAMGDVALTLFRELLLGVGKKVINKSGNKRQGLVLAFIILASTFAVAQYPTTGNKQRLGYQTSGDGLVFRGRSNDTTTIKSSGLNNAYHIYDTINNVLYSYVKTKGGWVFNNSDTVIIQGVTMPFDSITFNTAKDGTVGVGEVEYNDSQGSLIQGLKGGNVTNVIGQQLHQRVNNRTGATLNKGDVVYLSGSQGNRITVAKAIATSDPTSANTFGIVAESIADNQSGYIITEGLITGLNTSSLTQDSAVYLSGTTAGALTSTKPQAPIHGVYIGVCLKTNAGSGEVFVKIRNGQELDELHDIQISSPVNNASLYFKSNEGLWRDTTAALLVSDTASMLTNYLRTGVAASTYLPLTGGTMTGTIKRQDGNYNDNPNTFYYNILNYGARLNNNISTSPSAQITFTDRPGTFGFPYAVRTSDIHLMVARNWNGSSYGKYLDTTLSVVANQDGGRVGISKLNPAYKLDVNGTLGVSGPSTFLDLQGAGSRMVVAGSGGLLSTQAIPTGTVTDVTASSPMASTGGTTPNISMTAAGVNVSGYVTHDGTQIFTGNKSFLGQTTFNGIAFFKDYTYQATRLAGLSSTDRFATVTLGSGLSLSAGVLSATSGGVTSVTASTPLSSSGGTTPNITIADAGTGSSGVVNTTTQSFAGNKTFTGTLDVTSTGTFGGRVKTNWLERNYAYSTSSSFTISVNTTWQDINTNVLTTITLPNAATYPGKELHIRQTGTGNLQSSSSNIIPFNTPPTGSTSTGILTASLYEAITLVSDGTNWIIMQRSGN